LENILKGNFMKRVCKIVLSGLFISLLFGSPTYSASPNHTEINFYQNKNIVVFNDNTEYFQLASIHTKKARRKAKNKISGAAKKTGRAVKKTTNKAKRAANKEVKKTGRAVKKTTRKIGKTGAAVGGAVVGAGVAAGAAIASGANAVVDAAKGFKFSQQKPFAKSGKCKSKRPGKLNASYCNYAQVNMKACARIFGKKACLGPGRFKTEVAGTTGVVTYLNQKTGSLGATLDAKQTVTLNFFGKPVKVGLSCQFTKGAKSSWSRTFGVNYQTPAFPPITSTDVLEAIITRGMKAAAKSAAKSAAIKANSKNMNQAMSGHAGMASAGEMAKLMQSSGCNFIIPEATLFKGIGSFNLATAGVRITVAAKNWKINPKRKYASVDLVVSSGVEAAVGGSENKIAGKRVKMPGYSWGKDFANLVKYNVSTGGKGKDNSRASTDSRNKKAPKLAYNPKYNKQIASSGQQQRRAKRPPPRGNNRALAGIMNKPVCIRAAKGQYVVVEKNKKQVNANRRKCGPWETFIIRGNNTIQNAHWKTYLSCQPNGRLEGNRPKVGSWEKIRVIPQGRGQYAFRCMAHGRKFLVAEGAGGKNMNANRPKVGGWEKFRIERKR